MRKVVLIVFLFIHLNSFAQELFVFTEPASNMLAKSFLDIAPSVQFIINSQARIDIGYRRQLYSTMDRRAPNGMVLKFEYLLFNVFR